MTWFSATLSVELLVFHFLLGTAGGIGHAMLIGEDVWRVVLSGLLGGLLAVLARDNLSSGLLRNAIVFPGIVLALVVRAAAIHDTGAPFSALSPALLALVVGFAVPWFLRTVGSKVLKKELLGRGDVKTQSMIGCFLLLPALGRFWAVLFLLSFLVGLLGRSRGRMPTGYLYLCAAAIALVPQTESWASAASSWFSTTAASAREAVSKLSETHDELVTSAILAVRLIAVGLMMWVAGFFARLGGQFRMALFGERMAAEVSVGFMRPGLRFLMFYAMPIALAAASAWALPMRWEMGACIVAAVLWICAETGVRAQLQRGKPHYLSAIKPELRQDAWKHMVGDFRRQMRFKL